MFLFLTGCVSHCFSTWAQMFSVAVDCVSQNKLCCTTEEHCCEIKECRFVVMCHEHVKEKRYKIPLSKYFFSTWHWNSNDFSFNKSVF